MNTRKAACDPCRTAKVACDHKNPVCTRCLDSNRASACSYRPLPFKKRRLKQQEPAVTEPQVERSTFPSPALGTESSTSRHGFAGGLSGTSPSSKPGPYPNPGYLGSSSHVAIFNQIHPEAADTTGEADRSSPVSVTHHAYPRAADFEHSLTLASQMLKDLFNGFSVAAMKDLVLFWLASGVNLALAEPFVKACAETMDYIRTLLRSYGTDWHLDLARHLLQNSTRPLRYDKETLLSVFADQFCAQNVRWETLGIFFLAVVRSTLDIRLFPGLYTTEAQKHSLQRLAMRLGRCALDLCLSLDCLNDLQLVLQYENFIVISYIEGNQSLHCWRSLGDVIASIFALGYHENLDLKSNAPRFLTQLRKTAFARIYSADKNIALFLGRPPRMSKRFCYFQLPSDHDILDRHDHRPGPHETYYWNANASMNYTAETRWSALCASLKEEVLELNNDTKHQDHTEEASTITNKAEKYWQALPSSFVLSGNLKQCLRTLFERDFLVSTRLNQLHVLFLVRLVLLKDMTKPDDYIIGIAQEMLTRVVEAILFRDQLGNSGTGLVWKVTHYGLPAAGILLLALLTACEKPDSLRSATFRIWQELTILVAEVQMGTIVHQDEPNYALLSKATETIQTFLETSSWNEVHNRSDVVAEPQIPYDNIDWSLDLGPDPWNMEYTFWQNLGEHPFLSGTEFGGQDLT